MKNITQNIGNKIPQNPNPDKPELKFVVRLRRIYLISPTLQGNKNQILETPSESAGPRGKDQIIKVGLHSGF